MLERYFVKPSTVDRIRGNVAGAYIEHYVERMHEQGYAAHNVHSRIPLLCQFGQFASLRGAIDGGSALAHVEAFATHWQALHGKTCKSADARAKVAQVARGPVRQMLELALRGSVEPHRQHKAFPFEAAASGFANYLRDERGLKEATVGHYAHFLGDPSDFLRRVNSEPLATFSSALLAAFIVDRCPGLARTSRRHLCGALRVFLRYCHREGLVFDLSTSVEMPRTCRLADVLPRCPTG